MQINISEMFGQYCISDADGQALYDLVKPQLIAGQTVELDFQSVNVFASLFFNFAIGQLLRDFSSEQLKAHVKFTGLSSTGRSILDQVIKRAKRYYSDSHYRQAVDTVLEEEAVAL